MCDIICIIQDITSSLLTSNHHFEDITPSILDIMSMVSVITPTLSLISQPLYVWYHIQYMWDSLSTILMTSYPLCMATQPCVWLHHTQHMNDMICATEDVTSTLSHQATISMTSHPLQAWHHTRCIRHCTNSIFVITNSPVLSHPLLYDITPTICVTLYALYITLYPLLMSSHYSTYDSTNLTYEYTSSMQFKIYTIPLTSQSLVCVITPTVFRASHPLFIWHHTRDRYSIFCTIEDITSSLYEIKPSLLWHHTHYIWHRIYAISVTTSTLLMISHQLYLWNIILYICRHHIHCIQQHIHYICAITATIPWSHTHTFHDITPFVYMTLHPLYV